MVNQKPDPHDVAGWSSYLRWLATGQANEAVEQLLDARAAARRALDEATLAARPRNTVGECLGV